MSPMTWLWFLSLYWQLLRFPPACVFPLTPEWSSSCQPLSQLLTCLTLSTCFPGTFMLVHDAVVHLVTLGRDLGAVLEASFSLMLISPQVLSLSPKYLLNPAFWAQILHCSPGLHCQVWTLLDWQQEPTPAATCPPLFSLEFTLHIAARMISEKHKYDCSLA